MFVKQTHPSRNGSALVSVMVPLFGVLVLGYAFFRTTLAAKHDARSDLDEQRAFFLAEAGLHESFESSREGNSGAVGTPDAPALLGGGVVWVVATDLGNDTRQLVSTAMAGSGRAALEAVIHVRPEKPPLFVATLNSKENLTLNEGVMIDSFDSALGTYVSQATQTSHGYTYAGNNGDVRSNADVILNAHSTVFGDAVPGPEHLVTFATGSYVDGAIEPAQEPFNFPAIDVPMFPPQGNYTVAPLAMKTLAPGNYDFDAFTIGKDARLTITGPATVVVDSFVGGKTAKLNIDATNGPITFYVRGTYTHTSGFECASVGSSPMALAFLIDGTQNVVFPSATKVRGAYYAPNTNILFANGNECWGAFAANRIDMSNDMRFHFDETLLDHWAGEGQDGSDPVSVLAWQRTAVMPSSLLADRRDPMSVLDLDPRDLASPGNSWR
jgi:hypothetical protein